MAAVLPRLCALVLPFLAVATGLDVPSHGCYWTECQSKWFEICAAGHFLDSQSDNCDGLCTESKSPPCLPLHTHFYCCIPGTPRVTNKCGHCKNKVDFGKEFICCSDCSNPTFMNKDSKLGYCKSGAELTMQLKPQDSGGGRKKNEVGRIESNTIQAPPTLSTPEFARRWLPPARRPPPATPRPPPVTPLPSAAAPAPLPTGGCRPPPATPLPSAAAPSATAHRWLPPARRPPSATPRVQPSREAGSREQSRVYIYID